MSAWGRAARFYDLQLPLERAALDTALDLAAVCPGDRLLDLATGTGALLRVLVARPGPPDVAIGIDSSAEMLAAVPPLPCGWRVQEAEATRLPFADGSFDVVTATYLLHLLEPPERRRAIAEVRRVLRPAGRLVVVTVIAPRSKLAAGAFAPIAAGARWSSGIMSGMQPLDPRPELIDGGFTVQETQRRSRGYPSLVVLAERKP